MGGANKSKLPVISLSSPSISARDSSISTPLPHPFIPLSLSFWFNVHTNT